MAGTARRQKAFWVKFPCVLRPHATVIISATRNAQLRRMCQQTHDTDLQKHLSLVGANHIRFSDDVPIIPLADFDDPERWEGRKSNLQTRCSSHLRSLSPRKGATVKRRHNKPKRPVATDETSVSIIHESHKLATLHGATTFFLLLLRGGQFWRTTEATQALVR